MHYNCLVFLIYSFFQEMFAPKSSCSDFLISRWLLTKIFSSSSEFWPSILSFRWFLTKNSYFYITFDQNIFHLDCRSLSSLTLQPILVHDGTGLSPEIISIVIITIIIIVFFIGPRSDHSLPMSVTHWLTHSLTDWRTCWHLMSQPCWKLIELALAD